MQIYYLFLLSIILISCEFEKNEIDIIDSRYQNNLSENKTVTPRPDCTVGYTFTGGVGTDPTTGQSNFLFTWDFSNALVACNIELAIEFRTTTNMPCPGYPTPNGQTSTHYETFPISINSNGIASVYFNPIAGNMIANKTFEYRTIITGTSCSRKEICQTIGDWQGPLCSYML